MGNISLLAFLFSTRCAFGGVVPANLCPELVLREARIEALEVELSTRRIEPEQLVNELEAYRAVTTFEASGWHYAQLVFREHRHMPTRQFFFGNSFHDLNELADFEKVLQDHGQTPILIAVGLDRSLGYAPTPASTRFVEIVSQLHRDTQVRLLIYSYWDNCITRSLTELGIPSH